MTRWDWVHLWGLLRSLTRSDTGTCGTWVGLGFYQTLLSESKGVMTNGRVLWLEKTGRRVKLAAKWHWHHCTNPGPSEASDISSMVSLTARRAIR